MKRDSWYKIKMVNGKELCIPTFHVVAENRKLNNGHIITELTIDDFEQFINLLSIELQRVNND